MCPKSNPHVSTCTESHPEVPPWRGSVPQEAKPNVFLLLERGRRGVFLFCFFLFQTRNCELQESYSEHSPEKTHKGIVLNLGQRFIKSCGRVFFYFLFFYNRGKMWKVEEEDMGLRRPDIHKPHGTINPPRGFMPPVKCVRLPV